MTCMSTQFTTVIKALHFAVQGIAEIRVTNNSAVIPPGSFQTCFEIEAIEDEIIENKDILRATVQPLNPNDRVLNGSTLITVIDNDSM